MFQRTFCIWNVVDHFNMFHSGLFQYETYWNKTTNLTLLSTLQSNLHSKLKVCKLGVKCNVLSTKSRPQTRHRYSNAPCYAVIYLDLVILQIAWPFPFCQFTSGKFFHCHLNIVRRIRVFFSYKNLFLFLHQTYLSVVFNFNKLSIRTINNVISAFVSILQVT